MLTPALHHEELRSFQVISPLTDRHGLPLLHLNVEAAPPDDCSLIQADHRAGDDFFALRICYLGFSQLDLGPGRVTSWILEFIFNIWCNRFPLIKPGPSLQSCRCCWRVNQG